MLCLEAECDLALTTEVIYLLNCFVALSCTKQEMMFIKTEKQCVYMAYVTMSVYLSSERSGIGEF